MSGSIIGDIDAAARAIPGLRLNMSAYAEAIEAFRKAGGGAEAEAALCDAVFDYAAGEYEFAAPPGPAPRLVAFQDGLHAGSLADVLFDLTHERTIVIYSKSVAVAAKTRDTAYHGGYPGRPGYDKGHARAHAHGGPEGGPNYFPQAPQLNRRFGRLEGQPPTRLSERGHLWRKIEEHLAAHAGTISFVRLLYPPFDATDVPAQCEYGLLAQGLQFRAVIFPN
jgi:hypothetical protein